MYRDWVSFRKCMRYVVRTSCGHSLRISRLFSFAVSDSWFQETVFRDWLQCRRQRLDSSASCALEIISVPCTRMCHTRDQLWHVIHSCVSRCRCMDICTVTHALYATSIPSLQTMKDMCTDMIADTCTDVCTDMQLVHVILESLLGLLNTCACRIHFRNKTQSCASTHLTPQPQSLFAPFDPFHFLHVRLHTGRPAIESHHHHIILTKPVAFFGNTMEDLLGHVSSTHGTRRVSWFQPCCGIRLYTHGLYTCLHTGDALEPQPETSNTPGKHNIAGSLSVVQGILGVPFMAILVTTLRPGNFSYYSLAWQF